MRSNFIDLKKNLTIVRNRYLYSFVQNDTDLFIKIYFCYKYIYYMNAIRVARQKKRPF